MRFGILTLVVFHFATAAAAQHAHNPPAVVEVGQAQFAALAEIVAELRQRPDTDWRMVNISALRAHLVDMDNVTMRAFVEQTATETGAVFTVTGDPVVAASVQTMIVAHSPMLAQATGWRVSAGTHEGGATMTVEAASGIDRDMILGLGFFGVMTIGAHHQQHHLMIAQGGMPH